MKNKSKVLNFVSIIMLLILIQIGLFIVLDTPFIWKFFPGDSGLLFPLLFFVPLILSKVSLENKENVLAKIIIGISIILLIVTGALAFYVFALGSAWNN